MLLTELQGPRLDGFELARQLRPGLRLMVAATASGRLADLRHCREAGFDYFPGKPFDPEELLELLANCPAGASEASAGHHAEGSARRGA